MRVRLLGNDAVNSSFMPRLRYFATSPTGPDLACIVDVTLDLGYLWHAMSNSLDLA
jgi:hypothetical protein